MTRPVDDPRSAAAYDTLTLNSEALADDWWNPQDVFENVTALVVGALDLYDQDPAAFKAWLAEAHERAASDTDDTDVSPPCSSN